MLLLALFIEYFKIGLFAIGGGMATIPFLTKLADKTHWFTQMDLLNMIAVSESTPGPIGVNTATYVGFHIDGLTGMLSATIGLVTPSVIVVIAIYSVLKKFGQNHYVKSGMYGLRAASCGLIAAAGLLVAKVTLIDAAVWKETGNFFSSLIGSRLLLAAVLLILTTKFKKVHPVVWLAAAAEVGVVLQFGRKKNKKLSCFHRKGKAGELIFIYGVEGKGRPWLFNKDKTVLICCHAVPYGEVKKDDSKVTSYLVKAIPG